MKLGVALFLTLSVFTGCVGCGSNSGASSIGVRVNVTGAFKAIEAGGGPVTLTASIAGGAGGASQNVVWTLSSANTSCSPACGTLKTSGSSGLSAQYTPPASVPLNGEATITARSVQDDKQVFAFNFQITAAITVSISPKFSNQTAGGPVVNLTATITNDATSAGLTWSLNAGNASCSPQCGTLTVDPAPSLTAHYQPPAVAPAGAAASPTIAAASVADPAKNDSFTFTIAAPPISVQITNKFSSATVGGAAVLVNANVTNDTTNNAGVTWTLSSSSGPCATACGTLVPSPSPSFSATYTPPASAPAGANASPTITATSVTDTTKSDSFGFNIVSASSVFKGSYVFQLRGFDLAGTPMAMAGSLASDGSGNITRGELDLNDNGTVTNTGSISGTYAVDTSFNGIPRVTINLTVGATALVLKAVLSSDGTRGRMIEDDQTFRLNAGTLLLQDPSALSGGTPAGTYVFGLDSDAGTSTINGVKTTGRIVEAGQFTFAPGAASITGGIADAGQSGAASVLLGGGKTPAAISPGVATPPDASGRGTFTLTINGNANNYAYYIVDSSQLMLIESDSGGAFMTVQSGSAQSQKPLTADSLNTPASVGALTGTTISNGSVSTYVIVGVLTVSGGSSVTANYEYNSAGTQPTSQTPVTSSGGIVYSYDQTTGRLVLVNGFFFGAAVYLSDAGRGYIIDITPGGNGVNHAFSGPLIPQSAGPFSLQNHVYGNYVAIGGGSAIPGLPNFDLAANFDASGVWSGLIDFTNSDQNVGLNGQAQNVPIGGQFSLLDASFGRGVISLPAGAFGDFTSTQGVFASYYIVGPHQLVAIGQGPGGLGGDPSGILFFDPE